MEKRTVPNFSIKQYLGEKIISEEIIKKLLNIAIKIENHYGIPQDIEWTLKNNCIYILQSRPITSLS